MTNRGESGEKKWEQKRGRFSFTKNEERYKHSGTGKKGWLGVARWKRN